VERTKIVHLTSVAPDSMSCGALRMFTQNFMPVGFSKAGSDELKFCICLEGMVTIHDQLKMPDRCHRLPVNWGRWAAHTLLIGLTKSQKQKQSVKDGGLEIWSYFFRHVYKALWWRECSRNICSFPLIGSLPNRRQNHQAFVGCFPFWLK